MTIFAILADIHANLAALLAVARDAQAVAAQAGEQLHFVCLGDVVDYGPEPNECMQWIVDNVAPRRTLQGNHDHEAAAPLAQPLQHVSEQYRPITTWTRAALERRWRQKLQAWPSLCSGDGLLENFTLFHGDLEEPLTGRIDFVGAARRNMNGLPTAYGLFGHTHVQGYFSREPLRLQYIYMMHLTGPKNASTQQVQTWRPVDRGRWHKLPHPPALFNPGSVGQPRCHSLQRPDRRAAYMLLRLDGDGDGTFQFRRVEYDLMQTVNHLRRLEFGQELFSRNGHRIESPETVGNVDPRTEEDLTGEHLQVMNVELTAIIERLVPNLINGC